MFGILKHSPRRASAILFAVAIILVLMIPIAAFAAPTILYDFATPIFGLAAAPDGSLLVADFGAGILELRNGIGNLLIPLPGVTDIAPIGRGDMFALTSFGSPDLGWKLFRVSHSQMREIADLLAFESAVNPDGGAIDSNPFDVAMLSGTKALVADAAGNDLVVVDQRTAVDWVATLPVALASTDNIKNLANCPTPPSGL
jgi:hypothetical protein